MTSNMILLHISSSGSRTSLDLTGAIFFSWHAEFCMMTRTLQSSIQVLQEDWPKLDGSGVRRPGLSSFVVGRTFSWGEVTHKTHPPTKSTAPDTGPLGSGVPTQSTVKMIQWSRTFRQGPQSPLDRVLRVHQRVHQSDAQQHRPESSEWDSSPPRGDVLSGRCLRG